MPENTHHTEVTINTNTDQLRDELNAISAISEKFGRKLSSAFIDAAVKGKSLSSVLKSLALSLSQMTLKQALQPITKAISGAVFGGATNQIKPFAKGGVLNTPTLFPLNGKMGLAGEAGPEAILPLSRDANGRLGVGSPNQTSNVTINVNITTSDAQSFMRSESQISAMLQRAVARGSRNR